MATSKMEYLSAVLDDETGRFEQRRILDELAKDEELRKAWGNYTLIGETLRDSSQEVIVDHSFLDNLDQKLAQEPEHTIQTRRWVKPVTGVALAASVAIVSMITLQSFLGEKTSEPTEIIKLGEPAVIIGSEESQVNQELQARKTYEYYVSQHIENASTHPISPSIRSVSYPINH